MARKKAATPGQDIADKVKSGQLDASGALQAIKDQLQGGLTPDDTDLIDSDSEGPDADDQGQTPEHAAQDKKDDDDRRSRIQAIGHRLYQQAKDQVQLRQQTEERWYSDIRQFNGLYDPGTFSDDESTEQPYGSRVFVPLTRRLVTICEGRLVDVIFQAGERNFVLKPSPVPDIEQGDQLAGQLPADHPITQPDGSTIPAGDLAAAFKAHMEQAEKACDGMQREIDDQLSECGYSTQARNAIHDAVLMGTGVLKGPVALYKTQKRWTMDPETGAYSLSMERRPVPVTTRVDPWNFFPDMSATTVDECEFAYERHFLTKKQLSNLKDMEFVDVEALRQILGADPTTPSDNHRERLRAINGANGAKDKRYEVWEYHGPLSVEDLQDCGCDVTDADPLEQHTGIVWFCEGVVLKAALNPLDTGKLPFRVFCWQKDESNIFGFGLPYEVRDLQITANSSNRAIQDNMGLCVGPQVIVDDTVIEPVNGRWDLEPRKFWRNKKGANGKEALQFVDIESRMQELMVVFTTAKGLIEEVGTLPAFMGGQDNQGPMNSAMEASLSWTAANIWVRRCVRNWDDDMVTPLIGDYFDWNMQHSAKEEIKGDSQVQALGITALVELEGQAVKLQAFTNAAKQFGIPLSNQIQMLRQYARALKMDPDLMLPTDAEIQKMQQQEASQPTPPDPETLKAKVAEDDIGLRRQEMAQRHEDNMVRLQIAQATIASRDNTTMAATKAKYFTDIQHTQMEVQDRQAQRGHEAQMFNADAQLQAQDAQAQRGHEAQLANAGHAMTANLAHHEVVNRPPPPPPAGAMQ
jgi:hypothetical protein